MKYLKTFEKKYEYLNAEDSVKIEKFVREYIDYQDVIGKINDLTIRDFKHYFFNYRAIFDDMISSNNYITDNNIYYEVDKYCLDNRLYFNPPALRNSLENILNIVYMEYNYFDYPYHFEDKLNNKLIKLFKQNPEKYVKNYKSWEIDLNSKVKKACQIILDTDKNMKKYNL